MHTRRLLSSLVVISVLGSALFSALLVGQPHSAQAAGESLKPLSDARVIDLTSSFRNVDPLTGVQAPLRTTRDVCPSGCTYSSIQAAIDAADPGDTVQVGAGTYDESLTLDKAVSLLGADAATTIVQASSGRVLTVNGGGADGESAASGVSAAGAEEVSRAYRRRTCTTCGRIVDAPPLQGRDG